MDDGSAATRCSAAGVEVQQYHPLRWYNLGRLNNRTHRKLLVVDGTLGFTGGVGIADEWTGNAQDPDHWRDIALQRRRAGGGADAGGVHRQLDQDHRPRSCMATTISRRCAGGRRMRAQMFSSSPSGGSESMHADVPAGDHRGGDARIDIASAYFVPDDADASRRWSTRCSAACGVRIITARASISIARSCAVPRAALWGELLEAGAEMYEYQPTMYHCKVMIVDGLLVLGRLDQLRRPLLPPERRGQPQCLRPGVRRGADGDLRAGPAALPPLHAARLGAPARLGEGGRAGHGLAGTGALGHLLAAARALRWNSSASMNSSSPSASSMAGRGRWPKARLWT